MRLLIVTFLIGSFSPWAVAKKKEIPKEETVTLTCIAQACPDMAGYDGPCGSGWVAKVTAVPSSIAATGNLPECKCTPNKCVPNTPIRAVGVFERDTSLSADMDEKIFKVKAVLKK